jgi:hypothetical protein
MGLKNGGCGSEGSPIIGELVGWGNSPKCSHFERGKRRLSLLLGDR